MRYIKINIAQQELWLYDDQIITQRFVVSTAKKGVGEIAGSEQTPRGWHMIRAKIGAGCPINSVFVGRRPTGEIYSASLGRQYPERDWILTRILWLSGLELYKNRLGNVDTMRRYVYIHGCPDTALMGVADSHGCIRMHNTDMIALFDAIDFGTRVLIVEK